MATEGASLRSDLAVAPGEYLVEVLEEMGMSQADLARRMNRPTQTINEIAKGTKAILPETALQLERVTNVPAHMWLHLEKEFQLARARADEAKQLEEEATLFNPAVFREMAARGWVEPARSASDKARALWRFFGVASLTSIPEVRTYAAAFRVGAAGRADPYALAAWLRQGELQASGIAAAPFDAKKLRSTTDGLRALTRCERLDEWFADARATLADCGVALVLVERLTKTYANGATFWVSPEKVVVQLSDRYKWADVFWFTLFHELGHVLLHGKRQVFVDDGNGLVGPDRAVLEAEADRFASTALIPEEAYREFLFRGDLSEAAVKRFAQVLGVGPCIVVGRLEHDGHLHRSTLQHLKPRYDIHTVRSA